jgi:CheY-like chemotaxis protein
MSAEAKLTVLMMDDDLYWADAYVKWLKRSYHLMYFDSGNGVLAVLTASTPLNMFVIDIMMPTPIGVDASDTSNGFTTGLYLLRAMRDQLVHRKIPVIALTNYADMKWLRQQLEDVHFLPQQVRLEAKINHSPQSLGRLIQEVLSQWLNA